MSEETQGNLVTITEEDIRGLISSLFDPNTTETTPSIIEHEENSSYTANWRDFLTTDNYIYHTETDDSEEFEENNEDNEESQEQEESEEINESNTEVSQEAEPIQDTTIIPYNSGTELIDETTSRFSGAVWFEKINSIDLVLAGCGGIGSHLAFMLSRVKPHSMVIYDDDHVETVNMSGQLFGKSDIDLPKVVAISNMIHNYSDFYRINTMTTKFTENSSESNVMMCGFDNMRARRVFFEAWKTHIDKLSEEDRDKCLFVDGRLAAEEFQVFAITGNDKLNIERYQKEFLFSDDEADETTCSYKQTSFAASMIGAVMTNIFVNFVANLCDPLFMRDVPFLTSYNSQIMYFKTEV